MEQTKEQLTNRLIAAVRELPIEKVETILDFVGFLQSQYSRRLPERGSPEAVLQALEQVGPLQFEPGELDSLLTDIEHMREADLAELTKLFPNIHLFQGSFLLGQP